MKKDLDKSKDELLQELQKLREEEKSLKEDQRRFGTLTGNLNGVVYRCRFDADYTMEFVSAGVRELTGYKPEDLTKGHKITWNKLICEEDRENVRIAIEKSLDKKERFTIKYRILDASGKIKWVWEQGCGIYNEGNELVALEGFITDISDLHRSEKALRISEQKFRDLYENAPVADFSLSPDGIILQCNNKTCSLLGYAAGSLTGMKFTDLYIDESRSKNKEGLSPDDVNTDTIVQDGEVRLRKADGSMVRVSLTVSWEKNSQGEIMSGRVLALDMEVVRRTEDDLQMALNRLSLATKSAGIGVWDQDLRTGEVIWNEKMYEMYGVDPSEFSSSNPLWKEVIHPEDAGETIKAYEYAVKNHEPIHTRFRIIRPDGTVRSITVHAIVITGHNGEPQRITGINIDETDRITNDEHILQLNRLYTILSNINQSIIRLRKLPDLFREACTIAVNDGHFDMAWIGMFSEAHENLEIMSWAGGDETYIKEIRERIDSNAYLNGPGFKAISTGKPVVIRNLSTQTEFDDLHGFFKKAPFNSAAFFPLIIDNQVRGLYSLYADAEGLFGKEEIRLLEELAGDIAYAIEFADKEEERAVYEIKLQEATNALEAIIEASPLAIIHLSPEGKVRLWNHAAEKIFGWTYEEVVGSFLPIVQNEKRQEFKIIREKVLSGYMYTSKELIRQRKDGSKIFISLSTAAIFDQDGKVNGIIEVIEEISLRKITETKLRESESRYRYLFQSNPHPMLVYDTTNLMILEVNDAAVIKYGYSRKEFQNMTVSDIRPREEVDKFLDHISGERAAIRHSGTWRHKLKDGSTIDVDITSHTLEYEGHNAVLVLAQDVTERKKWEEELIRAKEEAEQSNRLKDAFVANISHEIRTPLNSILGFSQLIHEYISEQIDPELEKYFENVSKSSHRLMRTVDMILNFSRLQVGAFNINPQPLNIPALLEQIVSENQPVAQNKDLELSFRNDIGDAFIMADEYCIIQAVSNLVDNAVKYTDKGFVKLKLYIDTRNFLALDVADSGIGISEQFFSELFKPYSQEDVGYTRSYEGIGLGLSMVKHYLELNGAGISFQSKRKKGTLFTISFNQYSSNQRMMSDPAFELLVNADPEQSKEKNQRVNVLVVEDDPFSQQYMETILEDRFTIFLAEGAGEALEVLSQNEISLIIMDISLKGEMDGLTLTMKLKKDREYGSIPIIVLTAHAFAEDRNRSFEAGSDAYFSKPFSPGDLIKKMDELIVIPD